MAKGEGRATTRKWRSWDTPFGRSWLVKNWKLGSLAGRISKGVTVGYSVILLSLHCCIYHRVVYVKQVGNMFASGCWIVGATFQGRLSRSDSSASSEDLFLCIPPLTYASDALLSVPVLSLWACLATTELDYKLLGFFQGSFLSAKGAWAVWLNVEAGVQKRWDCLASSGREWTAAFNSAELLHELICKTSPLEINLLIGKKGSELGKLRVLLFDIDQYKCCQELSSKKELVLM